MTEATLSMRKVSVADVLQFTGFHGRAYTLPVNLEKFLASAIVLAEKGGLLIRTPDGMMRADPGDYLVKDADGSIYPMKPDKFKELVASTKEKP